MEEVQTNKIEDIINHLKVWFEGTSDIVVSEKMYQEFTLTFMYCPHLVDMTKLNELIFPAIYYVWEKINSYPLIYLVMCLK